MARGARLEPDGAVGAADRHRLRGVVHYALATWEEEAITTTDDLSEVKRDFESFAPRAIGTRPGDARK